MTGFSALLEEQLAQGLIYGCVVMIGTPEEELFFRAAGTADRKTGVPMTREALFDMASVTKAVCTATLLARLHAEGRIDYDAPLTACLPEFRGKAAAIPTLRELAAHCSGIGNARPHYDPAMLQGSEALMAALHEIPVPTLPGTEYVYSCANYILLGLVIEKITGQALEQLAQKEIFDPAGMVRSSWGMPRPEFRNRTVHEYLPRGPIVPGEAAVPPEVWQLHLADELPSDPTARWALPRRIGNAGLFSCADDLARFARWLLKRPFPEETMRELCRNSAPAGLHPRSCGWDLEPTHVFSDSAIHHTGWSGQSFWIDFERPLFALVLTNRSEEYARAKSGRLELIRAALNETAK